MFTSTTHIEPAKGTASHIADLLQLTQQARRLPIRLAHFAKNPTSGPHPSIFRGRGMEFEEVRHYQPGDDVRAIDWRVTARTGQLHTKIFREEHERPFHFIVDHSHSMQFGTRVCFKSVMADYSCAALAWLAFHHGHRIGGAIVHEQSIWLKSQAGKKGLFSLLNKMTTTHAPHQSQQLHNTLEQFIHHSRGGEIFIIFSDFFDFSEHTQNLLKQLSYHYDIACIHIQDPLEQRLNQQGNYHFSNGKQTVNIAIHSQKDEKYYSDYMEKLHKEKQHFFIKNGIAYCTISTDQDPIVALEQAITDQALLRRQL
ncbi:hypothetical protein AVI51_05185 [Piscirickettsia salmonis]|uniref:DUF58 domain-containing protein n=1 Tax=Piscirickettsia salmonis TaxID=1238 RepID=A0A9Q5VBC8_PISSA|nr:DUF58 domain-containing protein [Piscirickettsia salmonis]ALA25498.1 conserved protein domain protein [Piscirickettsia salmonis]APS43012.1 hypothetical protein AVI48_00510 [Piscirickettsia salmonis]APS46360.1 hypothetical protein AVI49_01105 [Piscirickettsia salmonis]APS50310.1 hypothetical protein AVI50_05245 [Piscirickettsia salmonis]APS53510.1 hypothetical protein AVI51_05185 [Piscirickettsia salmonis]